MGEVMGVGGMRWVGVEYDQINKNDIGRQEE